MKFFLRKTKNTGYTIIETMIAISIFLIVIMIGMGALLNTSLLHSKSQDMRSIMDNLSFVMDDMSRNLRTGYDYRCSNDTVSSFTSSNINIPLSCPNGNIIAFESASGDPLDNSNQWVYAIDNGKVQRSVGSGAAGTFIVLTPEEVVIKPYPYSYFKVTGAEPPTGTSPDTQQPLVTIRLVGNIVNKKDNISTPFSLQTSVSQRLLDIVY